MRLLMAKNSIATQEFNYLYIYIMQRHGAMIFVPINDALISKSHDKVEVCETFFILS